MLKEEHAAKRNRLIKKMKELSNRIFVLFNMGKYDRLLKFIEREEQLIKRFQGDVPEEIKSLHTVWLFHKVAIYIYRGDLASSFRYANKLLKTARLYDNKRGISLGTQALGAYYWFSGDYDNAIGHYDRAIRLLEEQLKDLLDFMTISNQLYDATRISIDKEDLEYAKKFMNRLEEIRKLKPREVFINDRYRLAKAYLLKSSMRFRDRVLAEDLFREIIEEDLSHLIMKLEALSGLCELLLVELRVSDDITIISEIKPLLEKLISMAQHSGLYFFLIEAYILHGKLALVRFDMESSRRYFTQAGNMAEKYGFIGLANEIAGLHKAMMEKKDAWEQMEKNNAPISERMELARLDDHLKGKFRMRMMKMERVAEPPPKKEVF